MVSGGLPKLEYTFRGPHTGDDNILGSIFGSPM